MRAPGRGRLRHRLQGQGQDPGPRARHQDHPPGGPGRAGRLARRAARPLPGARRRSRRSSSTRTSSPSTTSATPTGCSYLAMEFIDGVGLDRVIANEGRLPVERAALLAAQVADALDFAHRNHVVHRDVKPANIMIETGDRVKVTDFGIAKVTDSGDHLTMTGSLLGTPSYMSPEQARGSVARRPQRPLRGGRHPLRDARPGRRPSAATPSPGSSSRSSPRSPGPSRSSTRDTPAEMVRIVEGARARPPRSATRAGASWRTTC